MITRLINHFSPTEKKDNQQYLASISEEDINMLVKIDASINHPDALTAFLATLYGQRKKAKRAPFMKWAWRIGIVAVLLITMLAFSTTISEKFQSSKAFIAEKWSTIFLKDEIEPQVVIPKVMHITITEPTVNIRIAPSLQGTVIATGYANETYVYLNTEQLDDDGVTWLAIQLTNGRTGYVSKKVATIQ